VALDTRSSAIKIMRELLCHVEAKPFRQGTSFSISELQPET